MSLDSDVQNLLDPDIRDLYDSASQKFSNPAVLKLSDYNIQNKDILNAFKSIKKYKCKVIFGKAFTDSEYIINGNALFPKEINISSSWLIHLAARPNDQKTTNAFLITLGHELAHHKFDKDLNAILKTFKYNRIGYYKLKYWIREVHHDFYGCQFFCKSSKQTLTDSCDYKKRYNKELLNGEDKKGFFHPSWKMRKEYTEHGAFDEKLLSMIASDCYSKKKKPKNLNDFFDKVLSVLEPITLIDDTGPQQQDKDSQQDAAHQ